MNKLYIFCGIPFAGKTTLAKKFAEHFGYTRIDLDDIKFKTFGNDVRDEKIDQHGWDRNYQEMYSQIESELGKGNTVVHDTGNFTVYERGLVRNIAEKLGIEAIAVFVNIPVETARQRLQDNRRASSRFDITDESFESAVAEMEAPQVSEKHLVFDGTIPVDEWIISVESSIK